MEYTISKPSICVGVVQPEKSKYFKMNNSENDYVFAN